MSPSPPICELWQHDTWLEKLMIIIESSHEEASKMFPLNCQLPYLIGQQAFHYECGGPNLNLRISKLSLLPLLIVQDK